MIRQIAPAFTVVCSVFILLCKTVWLFAVFLLESKRERIFSLHHWPRILDQAHYLWRSHKNLRVL